MTRKIVAVETYCLRLPYRKAVSFRGTANEKSGQYVLVRILADDGSEGFAKSNTRPTQNGEDAATVAHRIETFFKPRLVGLDPLSMNLIAAEIEKTKYCRTEKALLDIALWDLKGRILGQPVWRLLGGGPVEPIPLTWIAHGNTTDAMIEEASRMVLQRGFKALKLKVWKRSDEDLRMVREFAPKWARLSPFIATPTAPIRKPRRERSCPAFMNMAFSSSRSPATFSIPDGRRKWPGASTRGPWRPDLPVPGRRRQ